MDNQFNEALEALEKILQERQKNLTADLIRYLPEGWDIKFSLLEVIPSNVVFEPNRKPIAMKDALCAHAFMYCGLLPNDHRRATCTIRDEEWEMRVDEWLEKQSRYEILRFPGYGPKSLQLLIDVLKWHGYDTSRLEE